MNIGQLKSSNFLKRDDVGDGTIVTIESVTQQNVAKEGAPEEMKWVLHVREFEKGMVLNSTNGQLIAHALKSEESDDWTGKQVILFDDPSVSYAGKLTGGIRVRALPKTGNAPKPATAPAPGARSSNKDMLKARLRNHPEWNIKFTANDVNGWLKQNYGVTLTDLPEDKCGEVMEDERFDEMLSTVLTDPF